MAEENKPNHAELAPELAKLGPFTWLGRLSQAALALVGWRSVAIRAHVQEVLERSDVFSVEGYADRMRKTTGEFFLGVDDPVRHARERDWAKAALDQALARTAVEAKLDGWAADGRAQNTSDGRLDLHVGLCFPMLVRLTRELFGIELSRADFESIRFTNKYIFDPFSRSGREAAKRGRELVGVFTQCIEERLRVRPTEPQTVLDFLVAVPGSPSTANVGDLTRTMAGLVSGATAVTTFVFHRVAERLMALPECVALKAHALHDRARFDAYVREAWRFVPGPPIVYRRATRAFTLGERTRCPLHIEQGQKVIVNLAAAQLDERAVYQHPRSFDATRPAGESMLFGHGQHYCIGDRLGFATVSALARALFAGEGMPRQSAEPEQEEQGIVKHVVEFR